MRWFHDLVIFGLSKKNIFVLIVQLAVSNIRTETLCELQLSRYVEEAHRMILMTSEGTREADNFFFITF